MRPVPKALWLLAIVFSLVCAAAYIRRGDYFHKQSDQFYYLSVADSLRERGEVVPRVDLEPSIPPTANTGAAWVMAPFSGWSMDGVFVSVCLIYLLLHLGAVFPTYRLLEALGLDERAAFRATAIAYLSFPATLFALWPVNEGPSLTMCAWFLYFLIARPRPAGYLGMAALAPMFRAHIFILELAALACAVATRSKELARRSLASLAMSAVSLGVYRFAFPFHQKGLGQKLVGEGVLQYLLGSIPAAATHLLVPETLMTTLFKTHAPTAATLIGTGVLLALVGSFVRTRRSLDRRLWWLSASVVGLTVLALCFSTLVIARFFVPAYLFMVVILLQGAESLGARYATGLARAWVAVNCLVLAGFAFSGSTDPQFALLEDLKKAGPAARDFSVVYYSEDFPIHNRAIYGVLRRPSGSIRARAAEQRRFVYLAGIAEPPLATPGCRQEPHRQGQLVLTNVECP